jgi:hypothetical protein
MHWKTELLMRGLFCDRGNVRRARALSSATAYLTAFDNGTGCAPYLPEYFAQLGLDFFAPMPDSDRSDVWSVYTVLLSQRS